MDKDRPQPQVKLTSEEEFHPGAKLLSQLLQPMNVYWRGYRARLYRGTPQGGKLSPELFVAVLDTVIRGFNIKYPQWNILEHIQIYADDLMIAIVKGLEDKEGLIKKFQEYGEEHGLQMNRAKSGLLSHKRVAWFKHQDL
jgi:hypothetical protein